MIAGVRKRAVGVFPRRADTENALEELKNSGFAMDRVSVIVQDANPDDSISGTQVKEQVGDKSDQGAKLGALSGVTLGGLTGLLVGLGTLAIPGVGPIMLTGATATTLATTLAGASIGAVAGSLLGGLIGLGIPEERARVYNERVEKGHYLVIIDGTDAEITEAEIIFKRLGIEEFDIYEQPNEDNLHPAHINTNIDIAHSSHNPMKRGIGIFSHNRDAETTVASLYDRGFPMEKISIIAKETKGDEGIAEINPNLHGVNYPNQVDKAQAFTVETLSGVRGLATSVRVLIIPGVGRVIVGGTTAKALAAGMTQGTIGDEASSGSIAGGLITLGIPKDKARAYNDSFNRGNYLFFIDGTDADINQAEAILKRQGIEDFNTYDAIVLGKNDYQLHQLHNQDIHQQQPVYDSTHHSYSPTKDNEDPSVIIIDRRSEII
jgi:hypothetical protein